MALVLAGCPGHVPRVEGGSSGSEPDGAETGPATTTTEGEGSSSSSSGEPPGLGCGITPICDKGELVGSVQVSSSQDIALVEGYTSLTGYLYIEHTDLECLDFLACLGRVGRDLYIHGNEELVDVSGLNALVEVGAATSGKPYYEQEGTLVISDNAGLVTLDGFDALFNVRGSLSISRNDDLQEIRGFTGLIIVQYDLTIRDNPKLGSIEGLFALRAVGGAFAVTHNPRLCLSEVNRVGSGLQQGPYGDVSTAANDPDC